LNRQQYSLTLLVLAFSSFSADIGYYELSLKNKVVSGGYEYELWAINQLKKLRRFLIESRKAIYTRKTYDLIWLRPGYRWARRARDYPD